LSACTPLEAITNVQSAASRVVAERRDRNESIQADVIRLAVEDRSVIFAAAVRADAADPGSPENPSRSRRSRDTTRGLDAPR
jgi:hypothetical protein